MSIVWGEINVVGLLTIVGQFALLIVFIVRASERSIQASKAAENAQASANAAHDKLVGLEAMRQAIAEAHSCAKSCKEQIVLLNGGFAAYRESVAQNYISRESLRDETDHIEKTIENLGKHIERLIDNRGAVR